MIVVADTSPLNYLVLIDEIDLLPAIFGKVLLPQAVFLELQHPKTARRAPETLERQERSCPEESGDQQRCPPFHREF
jgi:predicted nucleic acid-binding protein